MLHQRDPYTAHVQAVETLTAAGITPPADWLALRERFTTETTETCLDRLTAAVLDGDRTADLTALRAGALAEALATAPSHAQVNNALRTAVSRRLRDIYQPHADANYEQVAEMFTTAGAAFAMLAKAVDPEADAATIVNAPTKVRAAWTDCELTAHKLDALVPVLQSAAELCGVSTVKPEMLLALLVDPAGGERRAVWEAFNHLGGRCGRWSALAAAGATIRAAQPLTTIEPYPQARPMEERWVTVGRGQHQRIIVDPETAATTPA